jgi:hypothetical protein
MVFNLKWSLIYSSLSGSLLAFIVLTVVFFAVFGFFFRFSRFQRTIIKHKITSKKSSKLILSFILIGTLVEGIYSRGFPLTGYVGGNVITYSDFGIPFFHVLLVTISCFFTVCIFFDYTNNFISTKNMLLSIVVSFLPEVLTFNRGMIVMTCITMFWLFLRRYATKLSIKKSVLIIIFVIIAMYGFGVSGNKRMNSNYGRPDLSMFHSDLIISQGEASDRFINSKIPKEFFWTYLYVSSPIGNLQNTISNYGNVQSQNSKNAKNFVLTQLFPDTLSKRFVPENEEAQPYLVIPTFNVSTTYADSYVYLRWSGVIIFAIFLFIFPLLYLIGLKVFANDYFEIGFGILCTIYALSFFSNFISFTGLSLQLWFPFILSFIGKFKKKNNY